MERIRNMFKSVKKKKNRRSNKMDISETWIHTKVRKKIKVNTMNGNKDKYTQKRETKRNRENQKKRKSRTRK